MGAEKMANDKLSSAKTAGRGFTRDGGIHLFSRFRYGNSSVYY